VVVLLSQLVIVISGFQGAGLEKAMTAQTEVKIRLLLTSEEYIDRNELTKLGGLSSAAFPLYGRILDDPKEDTYIVARTLGVLSIIKADRSQFLDRTVTKLSDSHSGVRRSAVQLLAQIGSDHDVAPVIAMLSDEDFTIGIAAAKTIQAIGGSRDLAALDTWLRVTNDKRYTPKYRQQYEELREYVAKARDGLKERLDKEKAKKPKS
jgi:HEAT repeat protein